MSDTFTRKQVHDAVSTWCRCGGKPATDAGCCDACLVWHRLEGQPERNPMTANQQQQPTQAEVIAALVAVCEEAKGWLRKLHHLEQCCRCEACVTLRNINAAIALARSATVPEVVLVEKLRETWELCDNERLQRMDELRNESEKWKLEGDWFGWNFFQGMASGTIWASIIYDRMRRLYFAEQPATLSALEQPNQTDAK